MNQLTSVPGPAIATSYLNTFNFTLNVSAFVIKTGTTTQWQADLAPMAASDMRNRRHVQLLLTWSTNAAHPVSLETLQVPISSCMLHVVQAMIIMQFDFALTNVPEPRLSPASTVLLVTTKSEAVQLSHGQVRQLLSQRPLCRPQGKVLPNCQSCKVLVLSSCLLTSADPIRPNLPLP
ncbi:hypothetical protein LAZ67_11003579 [Cordylochernes scorpioides]|uniref:Uncharacterized protein n=1 Tax=Cordylochernes scorpioides TaxID=51811 RepID=A0ABY6KZX0_9ARAC|nr:hypothetical protein LAZ67_11003579 [Cordylochernes scorpioides]